MRVVAETPQYATTSEQRPAPNNASSRIFHDSMAKGGPADQQAHSNNSRLEAQRRSKQQMDAINGATQDLSLESKQDQAGNGAFPLQLGTSATDDQSSRASTPVQQLSTEIVHQIEPFTEAGKLQGVNITFDSKTLQGLQVQIRHQDGKIAIRFVSPSQSISKLLSRHTEGLREALSGKGVQVSNIAITQRRTAEPGEGDGTYAHA